MVTQSRCGQVMSDSAEGDAPFPLRLRTFGSRQQLQVVTATAQRLQESGFYWGALNGREAAALLGPRPPGTFLLRDSAHGHHFFTLSVRTASGTKNLRIHSDGAAFYLPAPPPGSSPAPSPAPRFDCVLKLLQHYMLPAPGAEPAPSSCPAPSCPCHAPSSCQAPSCPCPGPAPSSCPAPSCPCPAPAPSSCHAPSCPCNAPSSCHAPSCPCHAPSSCPAPSCSCPAPSCSCPAPAPCAPRSAYFILSGAELVPLELVQPLRSCAPSLQHLCRRTVNGHLSARAHTPRLPRPLQDFLQEYDAPI